MSKKTWAIIGGGNGGQSMAAHLSLLGQKVRLFDVVSATVDVINEQGGINAIGEVVNGFGKLEFATTDIAKVADGADIITIVLPSLYHEDIAKKLIPYLHDGQIVFLHPEASCGALAFKKIMKDMGCKANIVLGAASTLVYVTRIVTPGTVEITGIKHVTYIAALPASDNEKLEAAICDTMPWFKICDNVLYTSLHNQNAMVHPLPVMLNTSRIEAEPHQDYLYYREAITPSIGHYIELMDKERVKIGEAYGLKMQDIRELELAMYQDGNLSLDDSIDVILKKAFPFATTKAPTSLRSRYLTEDVPYSLCSILSLASVAGVEAPAINAAVNLGRGLTDMDRGRDLEALGIGNMDKQALLDYITK